MEMTIQLHEYQFQIQKERTRLSQLRWVSTPPLVPGAVHQGNTQSLSPVHY